GRLRTRVQLGQNATIEVTAHQPAKAGRTMGRIARGASKKPDLLAISEISGGEGGIRTHGTLARTTVFETVPIDHSGTSPRGPLIRVGKSRGNASCGVDLQGFLRIFRAPSAGPSGPPCSFMPPASWAKTLEYPLGVVGWF